MRYALRRSRKPPGGHQGPETAETVRRESPAATSEDQTVGAYLQMQYGDEYSERWLSRQLRCSPQAAGELTAYWMPKGHPLWVEHSLGTFANMLGLDSRSVSALVLGKRNTEHPGPAGRPERSERPAKTHYQAHAQQHEHREGQHRSASPNPQYAPAPAASAQPEAAAPPRRAAQMEVSIGSAEGVRVVKQRQPTIVYRRPRKLAEQ